MKEKDVTNYEETLDEKGKRDFEEIATLLYLIKSFENIKAVNGNYSILDEIEQQTEILRLVDRDWSIEAKKIEDLTNLYLNRKKEPEQEILKKFLEVTSSLCSLFSELANKRGIISSLLYSYEQIFSYLESLTELEANEQELEKLNNIPDKKE